MLLKISRLSKLNKKYWIFRYSNSDFDEILSLILNKLEYDYIELLIWSFQLNLFNDIEYTLLNNNNRFLTIKLDKLNSIKILNPYIYEEIRLFEINMFNTTEKLFKITSDNYGEYTSIIMDKTIDKKRLSRLLDKISRQSDRGRSLTGDGSLSENED